MNYLSVFIQIIMIISLLVIAFFLYRYLLTSKKEKRINRFSIEALSEKQTSLFDKIDNLTEKIIKKISSFLEEKQLFKKYHLKYEKFIGLTEKDRTSYDFITNKILLSILVIVLTIVSDALRFKTVSFIQIFISFLIGFFALDIYYFFKQKKLKKDVENDLLQAVIIMNNAFKSGRSVMQSVELVSTQLEGVIANEFRKIYIDLSYGLDLEVVFERFSKRVPYKEASYMASSLIILNKTGGNVVKVFSSIEKSFIERKRLNDELNSSLAMSNFVFKVLVSMPLFIFLVIFVLDNDYFKPLISNTIGKVITVIILLLYISYIFIVKKITKLKE